MNQKIFGYSIIATYGSFFSGVYWADSHYSIGVMGAYAVAAIVMTVFIVEEAK